MCGIVGVLAKRPAADLLIEGLSRLEYRGYDSAGIATLVQGKINVRRAEGKLKNLATRLQQEPLAGTVGIGHTRWATHGKPTETNAHPHATERVTVVHNGIIENYLELRHELESKGHKFLSETDTESIAHLLDDCLAQGLSPQESMAAILKRLRGAFALGVLFSGHNDLLIGARRGSPLVVGYGKEEFYLGSDAIALAPLTNKITYLEEGDWVELYPHGATFHDEKNCVVTRPIQEASLSSSSTDKGHYPHFMLKEIFEQPAVIKATLSGYSSEDGGLHLPHLPFDWKRISRLTVVACGTAYYAGMIAKYWFEQLAQLPVDVDIASEFRYRGAPLSENGATLVISQSGETADTLAAVSYAKQNGQPIIAVVNVPQSSIARQADVVLPTIAGPEIGVASTKAFTTQLTVLLALAVAAGLDRRGLPLTKAMEILTALHNIPSLIETVLDEEERILEISKSLATTKDALYLGRGALYPLALEGALKLKEISYIHAEGYPAGELKHGPIALVDDGIPVIVLAPHNDLFEKTASNVQEVCARGGKLILFSDKTGIEKLGTKASQTFLLPDVPSTVEPILYAIPIQLLAYHAAVAKGTDVDQPRNLAKSVTVE